MRPPAEIEAGLALISVHADIEAHCEITHAGEGVALRIAETLTAGRPRIHLEGDATIEIGEGCNLGDLFIYAVHGARVRIGAGSSFNGIVRLLLHEPGSITIGAGALFGGEVDVSISDMHSIISESTGERMNWARDIVLGDRVWIGARVMIMKGAEIGSDSIIGAGSIVTGTIPANCVAAGNPAIVVRQGIRWTHDLKPVPTPG